MPPSQLSPTAIPQLKPSEGTAGPPIQQEPTEIPGGSAIATLFKDASGYVAAVVGTLAVLTVTLQLWNADLTVPFGYGGGDGMMYLMLVQSTLDNGWFLDNDRLGAPDGQNLRDFPLPDVLHFGAIKLLGRVFKNPAVVTNLYFLLPFPLTALTSYFALRRFRLGRLAAVVASVLYACAPYHFWRMIGHPMLAVYYMLPLATWIIVRLYQGRSPFLQTVPDGVRARWRVWNWQAAGAILVCALTGIAGVYYAFFTCFFLLAASIKAAFRHRQWRHIGSAAILILVIASVCAAAVAPNILYIARNGKNYETRREPYEADFYSLNVSEMLLPIASHRIPALARLREKYYLPPRTAKGEAASISPLGLVASVGFLWLVGRFLWRRREKEDRVEDALAYLTVAAVALGTIGGFGTSFNFYLSPMIRCYNRLSIYIAFFALAGLFLMVQRLVRRRVAGKWSFAAYAAGLGAVLLLGAFDQTATAFVPNYTEAKKQFVMDAEFGKRMEAALPVRAVVYQLPYVRFPESPPVHNLQDYELFRPYLHTHALRWSYGAVRGREASRRQAALAERPLADSLPVLADAGFNAVYLDRAAFEDNGAAIEVELTRLLGAEPQVSQTGRQVFFDMTRYAQVHHDSAKNLP
jgi:phosphoglycerol transferase